MGRWGNKLYQSDQALDYFFSVVTLRLEREIAYQFSPEQIFESSDWITNALAPIEIMLFLDQANIGSFLFLDSQDQAVHRWRKTFFNIWDAGWKTEKSTRSSDYPYSEPAYREQHRQAVVAMFDRMESVARFTTASNPLPPEFVPLLPEYPLPFFSKNRRLNWDNKEVVSFGRCAADMIEHLKKEIIYCLAAEVRPEALSLYPEEVPVSVDVLGVLCEAYECSPGFKPQVIQNWRDTYFQILRQYLEHDGIEWHEEEEINKTYRTAFDRLEAVAAKHPPPFWME